MTVPISATLGSTSCSSPPHSNDPDPATPTPFRSSLNVKTTSRKVFKKIYYLKPTWVNEMNIISLRRRENFSKLLSEAHTNYLCFDHEIYSFQTFKIVLSTRVFLRYQYSYFLLSFVLSTIFLPSKHFASLLPYTIHFILYIQCFCSFSESLRSRKLLPCQVFIKYNWEILRFSSD